ncbi:hypothetical protein BJ546DRAFT_992239 [Cryomyces antarcticus]
MNRSLAIGPAPGSLSASFELLLSTAGCWRESLQVPYKSARCLSLATCRPTSHEARHGCTSGRTLQSARPYRRELLCSKLLATLFSYLTSLLLGALNKHSATQLSQPSASIWAVGGVCRPFLFDLMWNAVVKRRTTGRVPHEKAQQSSP